MLYDTFLDIHIFSYLIWLLAFAGSLYYYFRIVKSADAAYQRTLIVRERKLTSMGAHIGVVGILISGGAMVSLPSGPQWGWFPFEAYPWLAIKQVIFCVILVIVFGISIPVGVKLKKLMKSADTDTVNDQERQQWKKAWLISLAVYLLVVVNSFLGWFRPGF